MIERVSATNQPEVDPVEQQIEETLRPRSFSSYIGQRAIKDNLKLAIEAATNRGEPIDHVLLYGPPGLGKTTMAGVIASEMRANIRVTSGPAIERAGDLASILTNLNDGDILFVDEIHRLPKTVEEVLYPAMEDFGIDVMLGKGPSAKSIRLDLPKFTIIGATTRAGALSAPLRDRFGIIHRLEYYSPAEIGQILHRSSEILKVSIESAAADEVAKRARLTPRIANRLLKRVRDFAEVNGTGTITLDLAQQALDMLEIDEIGLDASDRRILTAIISNYGGGPVGITTIAATVSEEPATVEDVYEPYLMQLGLLERTARGRRATKKAYLHLGIAPPPESNQPPLL
ncbi:MAG: Holliday junction branch migration DNA helicase RuvB [Candidatus Saccharimonadia bacterium]